MNICIASATQFEIKREMLLSDTHNLHFLVTGVGMLSSSVSLAMHVAHSKPDFVIQAGIAGSFTDRLQPGSVVLVENEYCGDTGVWENGQWNDLFDMKFQQADDPPFFDNCLPNEQVSRFNQTNLPFATGVSVNEITTDRIRKEILISKYGAEIETMEGASLHYVCRLCRVPFIQVRGISNAVGERNKQHWRIKEAIDNVNVATQQLLKALL